MNFTMKMTESQATAFRAWLGNLNMTQLNGDVAGLVHAMWVALGRPVETPVGRAVTLDATEL